MDEEQIWQQLESQNELFWEKCMSESCRLLSFNETKFSLINNDSAQSLDIGTNSDSLSHNTVNNSSDDESDDTDSEDQQKQSYLVDKSEDAGKSKTCFVASSVDDSFFKLHEMEAFLDNEDKKEMNRLNGRQEYSDEINYFESLSESGDSDGDVNDAKSVNSEHLMFADFFDTEDTVAELTNQLKQNKRAERDARNVQKEKHMIEDLGMESYDEENEDEYTRNDEIEKSEFDLREHRLKERIEEYEERALADKPWQLKGEIIASTRPKNSLLEEVLEFDSVSRPAPIITEETTLCLESIIKRRIKSISWDDVERKIKPINDQQDFRKNLVLQSEKSKESLAQVYEKEYLEKIQKLNSVNEDTTETEISPHVEIRKSMKDLFLKLDALSNFHFTAKPVAAEAKIISNIPAIEMEEAGAQLISRATLLAPEEVRARPISDEIGKSEKTTTDKNRERRKKKLKQKLIKKQNDKRMEEKEKLGIKITSKEKQTQLMSQVTKLRNVIKVKYHSEAQFFVNA